MATKRVNGVIDLRLVAPETLERVQKVESLKSENPDVPLKELCRRAGISLVYFFALRKSVRAAALCGGPLASHQSLG